jgi:hypothetical protein
MTKRILFYPLLFSAVMLCSCSRSTSVEDPGRAQRRAQYEAEEKQLQQDYRPPGRFQLLAARDVASDGHEIPIVLKLDTVTGEVWSYDTSLVASPNPKYPAITVIGWTPVELLKTAIDDVRSIPVYSVTNSKPQVTGAVGDLPSRTNK